MKTEKPTPRKLLKQGEKGKSFNSKDLMIWALLLSSLFTLCYATSFEPVAELFRVLVARHFAMPVGDFVRMAAWAAARVLAPLFGVATVCIVLISLAQSRGILAFGALSPDLNKLNPVNGFKNLFSVKVVKDAFKAVLYLLLTCVAATLVWRQSGSMLLQQVAVPVDALPAVWMDAAFSAGMTLLLCLMPVTALSGVAEWLIYIRDMKMDKNEVKQERKDTDGNPEVKKKRGELREELSAQAKSDIAGSDVILANPTHIAVGLWLHSEVVPMPFVTVHAKGNRARAVLAYARRIGIPVVTDIPLARGLYKRTRRYGFVSSDDLEPVLRLLRWLRDVERAGRVDE